MQPSNAMRLAVAPPRRLAKTLYRAAVGPPVPDPVRAWRGTASDGQRVLRVLHVGDCGVRRMEASHDLYGPPGYPLVAAERLLQDGIGIEFSHYFAVNFDSLPSMEKLRRYNRLSGDPDIVLVQVGSAYTRRILLPDTQRVHQLRDDIGRRVGRLVFAFYKVLRPCVRLFGRASAKYVDSHDVEAFVDRTQREWPHAAVVLVAPFRRSPAYPGTDPIAAQIEADLQAIAASRDGVSVFDANPALGRDPALRCATGYNLNGRGSQLVGAKLAGEILAQQVSEPVSS
jgi:hypothetical protein